MSDDDFASTLLCLGLVAGMVAEMNVFGFLRRLHEDLDSGADALHLQGTKATPRQVREVALEFQQKVNRVFEVKT